MRIVFKGPGIRKVENHRFGLCQSDMNYPAQYVIRVYGSVPSEWIGTEYVSYHRRADKRIEFSSISSLPRACPLVFRLLPWDKCRPFSFRLCRLQRCKKQISVLYTVPGLGHSVTETENRLRHPHKRCWWCELFPWQRRLKWNSRNEGAVKLTSKQFVTWLC